MGDAVRKISKNIRVLIVEDDQEVSRVFSAAFMKRGFKVYTASDGKGAIQKFKKREPHVVLLDVSMPGQDGHHVLREMRRNMKTYVPVIILTNMEVKEFAKESSLDSIDAYMSKADHNLTEIVNKTVEVLKWNKVEVD